MQVTEGACNALVSKRPSVSPQSGGGPLLHALQPVDQLLGQILF
jgi:hypothetical protein